MRFLSWLFSILRKPFVVPPPRPVQVVPLPAVNPAPDPARRDHVWYPFAI
jgi:hypothetical protein